MNHTGKNAVRMTNITKTFGTSTADHKVDLELRRGEILALLGENGSGKTTLMNILAGIYFPDSGTIEVHGQKVQIRSPRDAFQLGIGMIHQHFKLVDVFTAGENIVLGLPGTMYVDRRELNQKVQEIAWRYGFDLDPQKKVYNMSVSEKQTVEILKALYRGAEILILDEPTAVLTPQETQKLFTVLRNMKKDGKSIIIITHKLHEVLAISDRTAILRKGENAGTVDTASTTLEELTEKMVGQSVSLDIEHPQAVRGKEMLRVSELTCPGPDRGKALDQVSFSAYAGEILGIAGISGSGQKELCEAIAGLYPVSGGKILYNCGTAQGQEMENITGWPSGKIYQQGISMAFIPEDRLGMGLAPSMDMVDNVMLRSYRNNPGLFLNRKKPREISRRLIQELDIQTPGISTPVRRLSGGNVQKILLGREISNDPSVLIAAYPVRGLDIQTSHKIYHMLGEQKKKGTAVIFLGEDLDVLMELSDKLLVLCAGKASKVMDPKKTTKEEIGMMMLQSGWTPDHEEVKP